MSNKKIPPKLFVSYSWTTPHHVAWVIRFAEELRENGIDVILDKWDLKEGQDIHAFMEKMVTDPEIKKVLLICDKEYVVKADDRTGGVGTETQIITREIYEKQDQTKFVAVVTERDEVGKPYIPAFYGSRIFIDFSDPGTIYPENFEKLLRWVFDQPLHKKLPIGKKPAFMSEEGRAVGLATSSLYRRATDAIQNGRDNAMLPVGDYFQKLTEELEKLRIKNGEGDILDDLVVRSIESFLPYRDEVVKIFLLLSRVKDTDEAVQIVHRFLEGLIPYMDRPKSISTWTEDDFDNFKFIVHELYLYAVSCFIRNEKFDAAAVLIGTDYYLSDSFDGFDSRMISFWIFRQYLKSLKHRNDRLKLSRASLHADILKQRSGRSGIDFRDLMQTDLVLFLRSRLDYPNDQFGGWHWWPETLLYAGRLSKPFEIFARSQSIQYFNRMKCLLGIKSKEELVPLLNKINANPQMYLHQSGFSVYLPALIGYEQISTKD